MTYKTIAKIHTLLENEIRNAEREREALYAAGTRNESKWGFDLRYVEAYNKTRGSLDALYDALEDFESHDFH